jgi:hypothetical protein
MIIINKQAYAKNDAEFTDSLFNPINGKTCAGFYKQVKGGVKLYDAQKQIFAFVVNNKFNEQFFVSARKLDNGKTYYMHSLTDAGIQKLGFTELGYIAESNMARDIINQLKAV